MEGNGEMSDSDSGIILHSGSDSPTTTTTTTTTKDVTTHTRAMKLKHQSLQDRLQLCLLELKKLCIREAELTGELSADYPLAPGESPPKVRRRIGASFQLDEQSIPRGPEQESPLALVDAELALQLKIYEAARRLCREEHQNKAVRRSRLQQCKREEKRVKELQESAFRLRLQHGRSSPLPAFNVPLQDLGNSDDSSLSDSPVLDEDVHPPPLPSGPAGWDQDQDHLPQSFALPSPSTANSSIVSSPVASQPHTPVKRTPSQLTPSQLTPSQLTPSQLTPIRRTLSHHTSIKRTPSLLSPSQLNPGLFTPRRAGSPGLDSMLSFSSNPESDAPPIQPSPWFESSLDQPFQKSKKSRSSTKSTASTASSQVLPPLEACLEACLGSPSLPQQLAQLQLCDRLANGSPTTPEPRLHRHLSLRISNPETPQEERRGRTRSARRRLTDCSVTTPYIAGGSSADQYGSPKNPIDQYGSPHNPADQYGSPQNSTDQYGSPHNPADQYGTLQNPADQCDSIVPDSAGGSPASHYGTPGNAAGLYGTPENSGENPVDQYGSAVPETTRGHPEGPYGPPESTADHYGAPGTTRYADGPYGPPENFADHYGAPGTTRYPPGHYGSAVPDSTMGYPAGHYGPPETTRGYPAGPYGPPESLRGYPPFHRGSQAHSEDSHSDRCSTPRSGSVCQELQGEFPRARPFQHPGPPGGPGAHAFQGPGLYQGPRYQFAPSFNPHHYPGDVAYARDQDPVRGYRGPQAPPSRRDYVYAAEAPPMTGPRRGPQEARLSRSPSLWEPQRYRSNGAVPQRQLVDDQLKSWHHRNQFRAPRPRSLDRQGAVRVKTVTDWGSPLAHHQRYQEQVLKPRAQQRPLDEGPQRWLGEDSPRAVSQV